jgi:hypothetical protein
MSSHPQDACLELVDAEERHREHPDTFWIPSLAVRTTVHAGDRVQVCVGDKERLWLVVRGKYYAEGEILRYRAEVLSDPLSDEIERGDTIEIEPRHIMQVVTD